MRVRITFATAGPYTPLSVPMYEGAKVITSCTELRERIAARYTKYLASDVARFL